MYWLLIIFLLASSLTKAQSDEPAAKQNSFNQLNGNGLKVGFWQERKGELTTRGYYTDGVKEGTWETYLSDELILRIETFVNGKLEGIVLDFDRKGRITSVEHYQNNLLHGLSFIYNPLSSKLVKKQEYENGMLTGFYRSYYDNGKIQEEAFYAENQKNGPSRWFTRDGRLVAIYRYASGAFEGTQRTFYENDSTATITNYVNNKQDGEYKEFYRNGNLKVTGTYVEGNKEGNWTEYNELGKAVKVTKFKHGVEK